MSELQNEAVEPESILSDDHSNEETPVESAELATASEAEHEEQPQVDEQAKAQEAINKAINKKHFEAKEAERRAEEAERQLQEFQRKEQERMAAQYADIPPIPDAFDDDYDAKIKARDEALLAKARFDAQQQTLQQQEQARQQQAQADKARQFQEKAASYSKKALELGIKQEELQAAGNTVANYGLEDGLVLHILSDEDGPLITKHLAANPQEGYELAQTSPYEVGLKLASIKEKAKALKPKKSNTPPPTEKVEGSAVTPDDSYAHIKGASFE